MARLRLREHKQLTACDGTLEFRLHVSYRLDVALLMLGLVEQRATLSSSHLSSSCSSQGLKLVAVQAPRLLSTIRRC
eukprot:18651-Heterococcus_DN1.PRE.2